MYGSESLRTHKDSSFWQRPSVPIPSTDPYSQLQVKRCKASSERCRIPQGYKSFQVQGYIKFQVRPRAKVHWCLDCIKFQAAKLVAGPKDFLQQFKRVCDWEPVAKHNCINYIYICIYMDTKACCKQLSSQLLLWSWLLQGPVSIVALRVFI